MVPVILNPALGQGQDRRSSNHHKAKEASAAKEAKAKAEEKDIEDPRRHLIAGLHYPRVKMSTWMLLSRILVTAFSLHHSQRSFHRQHHRSRISPHQLRRHS